MYRHVIQQVPFVGRFLFADPKPPSPGLPPLFGANQMMPLETVGVLQLLQETQLFFS